MELPQYVNSSGVRCPSETAFTYNCGSEPIFRKTVSIPILKCHAYLYRRKKKIVAKINLKNRKTI